MILADENINYKIIKSFKESGFSVISVIDDYRGLLDEEILMLAKELDRIILTEDKDFGEWFFAHHVNDVKVIFLRYEHCDLLEITQALLELLKKNELFSQACFITLTKTKLRIRKA